jgi:hypothetical protein
MDSNCFCLTCGFFPTYRHKSSIPFIMRRHCNSEGHKKRMLVNQQKDYPMLEIAKLENNRVENRRKSIQQKKEESNEGFKKINQNVVIHFKI